LIGNHLITDREQNEQAMSKDENLVENMRKLVIKSTDGTTEKQIPKAGNLPKNRGSVDLPEWGHIDPEHVPQGKLTVSMLLAAIDMKHTSQKSHDQIASELHLNKKDVDDLLYFYRPFKSFTEGIKNPKLPQHKTVENRLSSGESNTEKLPPN
jgi:hypothetical protein